MKPIHSITDISDHYDAFLIDLWGVMHDGTKLYPGAKAAISALHEAGKQVIFLSNAPRKANKAEATLLKFGIPREAFVQVVTSGQVAYDTLLHDPSFGRRYYYLGPGKDEDILEGYQHLQPNEDEQDEDVLEDAPRFIRTSKPKNADFILNTGFEYDFQPEAEIRPTLQRLRAAGLPLLCVNPDLEVITPRGQLLCAGWAARAYGELGGEVHYVGKPHKAVYEVCFETLGQRNRLCAIGDNLLTDIKGANAANIDSLLITGGILKSEAGEHPSAEKLAELCKEASATPTYVAELFSA